MTIIKKIENCFKTAVPNPTDDNRRVQLGCHLEEVDEMMEANLKTFIKEVNELIDQIQNDPDFQLVFISLLDQRYMRRDQKDQFFEILKPKIIKIALRLDPKFVVMADALLKQTADEFLDLIYPPNTLIDFYILEVVQTLLKEIFLSTFSDKRATQFLKDMKVEVVTEKK